jgi:hypothetical protein
MAICQSNSTNLRKRAFLHGAQACILPEGEYVVARSIDDMQRIGL